MLYLISTWLFWSGIAFRRVGVKRGIQQRFDQQKDSIREDLRWVYLFKDFGWVCLVIRQFQVSGLWSCQRVKPAESTISYLPAEKELLRRRYHNGLKVYHHLAKFSRPSGHGYVPFPTPAQAVPPIARMLHQKPVAALSLHNRENDSPISQRSAERLSQAQEWRVFNCFFEEN